jgi:hypothetical protein
VETNGQLFSFWRVFDLWEDGVDLDLHISGSSDLEDRNESEA